MTEPLSHESRDKEMAEHIEVGESGKVRLPIALTEAEYGALVKVLRSVIDQGYGHRSLNQRLAGLMTKFMVARDVMYQHRHATLGERAQQ